MKRHQDDFGVRTTNKTNFSVLHTERIVICDLVVWADMAVCFVMRGKLLCE